MSNGAARSKVAMFAHICPCLGTWVAIMQQWSTWMQLTGSAYRHRSHAARQCNCVRVWFWAESNSLNYICKCIQYQYQLNMSFVSLLYSFSSTRFHFVVKQHSASGNWVCSCQTRDWFSWDALCACELWCVYRTWECIVLRFVYLLFVYLCMRSCWGPSPRLFHFPGFHAAYRTIWIRIKYWYSEIGRYPRPIIGTWESRDGHDMCQCQPTILVLTLSPKEPWSTPIWMASFI